MQQRLFVTTTTTTIAALCLCIILLSQCVSLTESVVTPQSDLCFLSHGGSSETFTINEAVPVGSIIGVLKVSTITRITL